RVAKPGGGPREFPVDPRQHVGRRSIRDVTVRPRRVLAVGRTGRVEQAGLRDQHEGTFRFASIPAIALRGRDLLQRAADVNGSGASDIPVAPGYRSVARPVDLVGT